MVDPDPDPDPPQRRFGHAPLGRRGLIVGVMLLAFLAIVGGSRLMRGTTGGVGGITQALAPFPGFPVVTPARARIGTTGSVRSAYGEIAQQGRVDWRRQFILAGQPWQDPRLTVDVPPVGRAGLRARSVFMVGERIGDWAQQLMGIPGLLEVAHRKGQLSVAAVAAQTRDLVSCLTGVWGRSMISGAALVAVAPATQADWVAHGAASGVPSSCVSAASG